MEAVFFGKRQGFAYTPGEPLAKRFVPTRIYLSSGLISGKYWRKLHNLSI